MFGSSLSQKPTNTNQSLELQNTPADTISALAWSPVANHLAVASWDKTLRIYDVQVTGMATNSVNAVPRSLFSLQTPILSCAWTRDGAGVLVGTADGKISLCSLASNQTTPVGGHEGPVVAIFHVPEMNNTVLSASHDKTVRFWPMPSGMPGNAIMTLPHSERIYCADLKFPLLTVGTADRKIYIYNLQAAMTGGGLTPYRTVESKLRLQSRVLCCFPDKTGYALASIEGRCSIACIDDVVSKEKNFEFKCHRTTSDEIYPVHAIDFHVSGVFLTAGGDGTIVIWDKDTKSRVRGFNSVNYPVTAAKFSTQGDLMAYAVGYDWAKGHDGGVNVPVKLFVHKLQESDVKVRPQTGGSSYGRRR